MGEKFCKGEKKWLLIVKGGALAFWREMEKFQISNSLLKNDDHSEGEHFNCILLVLLSFLNLNCNSWILTMIKGQMNNCSFIWTLSEIFVTSLELKLFLPSFAVSHLLKLF